MAAGAPAAEKPATSGQDKADPSKQNEDEAKAGPSGEGHPYFRSEVFVTYFRSALHFKTDGFARLVFDCIPR